MRKWNGGTNGEYHHMHSGERRLSRSPQGMNEIGQEGGGKEKKEKTKKKEFFLRGICQGEVWSGTLFWQRLHVSKRNIFEPKMAEF